MTANSPEPIQTQTFASRISNYDWAHASAKLYHCDGRDRVDRYLSFVGLKTETGSGLLSTMAEEAVPLEVALSNGKPSLVEFYANWCMSCQTMAPDVDCAEAAIWRSSKFRHAKCGQQQVVARSAVLSGRRHSPFCVLWGKMAAAIAQAIGEQPHSVMEANLVALASSAIRFLMLRQVDKPLRFLLLLQPHLAAVIPAVTVARSSISTLEVIGWVIAYLASF